MSQQHEVITTLKFKTDGSGKQIFQEMGQEIDKLAAQQRGPAGGNYAGPGGGFPHPASGDNGGGLSSVLGQVPGLSQFRNLGSAAGAAAAAYKYANYAANYAKTSDNPFLSEGEKGREIARHTIGGETAMRWNDAIQQRERKMLLATQRAEELRGYADINAHKSQYLFGQYGEQSAAQARVDALQGASPVAFDPGNRSTVGGAQRYKEELQLLGLRERANQATRDTVALRKQEEDSTKRLAFYEREVGNLTVKKAELFKQFQNAEGPAKVRLGGELERADIALQAANANAKAESERRRGLGSASAEAQAAAARAELDVRKGRLGILEQREQSASDQATNLGLMGPSGRLRGKFALEYLQANGLENAPESIIAAAQSVAPQTVRKLGEDYGQGLVSDFRKLAPEEYRDNLPGIRGDVDRERQGVREQELEIAKTEAKSLLSAVKDIGGVMRSIAAEIAQVKMDVEIKLRKSNGAK